MKIVQINATCGSGSTGKICVEVSKLLVQNNIENYILYVSGRSDYPLGIKCAGDQYIRVQSLKAYALGNWGFQSRKATKRIIAELERIRPDMVHLHNLHGHGCHLGMLFSYLKQKKIKTFWTFHDCWAFTGYCTHFTLAQCDRWKTECRQCPQKKRYSWLLDRSHELQEQKKNLLSGLDLTVITPSRWLAGLVKQSFFMDCPIQIIHNGIDLAVFAPTENNFREEHSLQGKHIVLGVSFGWSVKKGLDVFIALSKCLGSDYQIVLVGTNERTDAELPENILSIHRTQNQKELAEIYTAADVFVNPTREDNYPTVNMEAIACGTPVVTFRTGGSPESVDETCGAVVDCDNLDALRSEIVKACEMKAHTKEACLEKARGFAAEISFQKYIQLYGGEA